MMEAKCTKNCPAMESNACPHKTDDGGRSGDKVGNGLPLVTNKKRIATAIPRVVSCLSPCLTPYMCSFVKTSAFTRQLTPKILYMVSIVTSVQRPCCSTSLQHLILMARDVNGDATDASPSSTSSNSSCASLICLKDSCKAALRAFFRDLVSEPLLLFFFFLSFFSSALSFAILALAFLCFASNSGALMIEMPTCARLSAPTSFVPSPHIRVWKPPRLNACTTASFCLGACRAKTEINGTKSFKNSCALG
mmetsp:Transcript_6565/g.9988  ORF Transcript_6565/g.9988 Transcript_6565/m.9988 type:complete len:250 (-) Transcript_6565:962-1711(-)